MAINDVLGLTVELEADTKKFVKDLRKAAGNVDLGFNPTPLIRQFARSQKDIQKILTGTVADAAGKGFALTNIQGLTRKLTSVSDQIATSNKRVFELSIEMGRRGIEQQEKQRLKALRAEEKERLAGLQRQFKAEKTATDEVMQRRKKAMVQAAKLASKEHFKGTIKAGDAFADGITSAFSKIKSGDVSGLLKGLGGGVGGAGTKALKKAQEGGAGAGLLKGLGGLLTKVGPAIAAIGALAAGIGALVAIAVAADSAMKDLNRTLMTSGLAGADLADQYGRLGDTLTNISQHFAEAFTLKNVWGTTAKDHLEILGGFASAGVSFRQMKEGIAQAADGMKRLEEYTVAALTYSKLLGLSTQEMSSTMASYMEELGLTLEGVSGRFANITVAAKESGFATKRFFNMLLQATSGMSMYNVRLEEAAGLLINLGKILGQKMGGDFLQQLMKGFKDEGTQDRIKKTMTTGVKLSSRILQKDAVRSAEEFGRKLEELASKDQGKASAIQGILGDFGLGGLKGEDLAKALGKMSPQKLGMLTAQVGATGGAGAGLARSLMDLATQGQSFKGGLGGAQAARSSAGAGATLFLQLNEAQRVLGRSLDQIDLSEKEQLMAFEQITGKSGEAARQLRRVGMEMRGQYDTMRKAQEGGPEAWAEYNQKFADEWGVRINEASGALEKIVKSSDGTTRFEQMGGSLEDFFLSQGDRLKGMEDKKIAEDIMLAQEIAGNTTDMAKILEQGIEYLLSKIYSSVQYIASIMGQDKFSDEEKAARGRAMGEVSEKEEESRKELRRQQSAIDRLKLELKVGASPERKAEIEAEIDKRELAKKKLGGRVDAYRAISRSLGRMTAADAHKYGENLDAKGMIGAAAASPQAKDAIGRAIMAINPRADVAEHARSAGASAGWEAGRHIQSASFADKPWVGGRDSAQQLVSDIEGRESEKVWSGYAQEYLGLPMGVRSIDRLEGALEGPAAGEMRRKFGGAAAIKDEIPMEEWLRDIYIGEKRDADDRSKRELTAEEKQLKEQTDELVKAIESQNEERQVQELATLLARSGEEGGATALVSKARGLLQGRTGGMNLQRKVKDPNTGEEKSLGDILHGAAGTAAMGTALSRKGHSSPFMGPLPPPTQPGGDFAAFYSASKGRFTGRVDFNGRDNVAMEGRRSGGPRDTARSGGKGSIVINSFGNSAEIIRGLQAAAAAGVLS